MKLTMDVLRIDPERETERIVSTVRRQLSRILRRRGAVLGLSGGIDSSVTAALCVRAVGQDRVLGLLMPEGESASETLELSMLVATQLGIETVVEDITPLLDASGAYRRRDDALRSVVPEYGDGWLFKLVLPSLLDGERYRLFSAIVQAPDGKQRRVRLPPEAYLGIVAATNFKQRCRKMLEYYHADRLHYAVAGTPNRLEYDQGFFVKNGDGAADLKPIAHLYKSQVYDLAEHLGVPEEIRRRPPTTDTYSLAQSQEEFYFSLPYREMDLCLWARNNDVPAEQVAEAVGLRAEQVERVFRDIDTKRSTTRYAHLPPLLVTEVEGLELLPEQVRIG